jgi:hypothetical protein
MLQYADLRFLLVSMARSKSLPTPSLITRNEMLQTITCVFLNLSIQTVHSSSCCDVITPEQTSAFLGCLLLLSRRASCVSAGGGQGGAVLAGLSGGPVRAVPLGAD